MVAQRKLVNKVEAVNEKKTNSNKITSAEEEEELEAWCCGNFYNASGLEQHKNEAHDDREECPDCGDKFDDLNVLAEHYYAAHDDLEKEANKPVVKPEQSTSRAGAKGL